jgi:DNA mismatch endonuclease (patch repair protein)
MVDHVNSKKRSEIMRAVRTKNGQYELLVRSALHRLGYRFRTHGANLPGTPDVVLPKWKTVVFVHGCYWHRHGCSKSTTPKTNQDFWLKKFEANVSRDSVAVRQLESMGWHVIVVWQCELGSLEKVIATLRLLLPAR